MILTLEITGPEAAPLGPARSHAFSTQGGVIGRAKNSDWVLSHTKVSGRHAVVSYLDGTFYIEDTSTNGVFINSSKNRLVQGRRYALQSGDRILIEPYAIDVTVSDEEESFSSERFERFHDSHRGADRGLPADPFNSDNRFRGAPVPRATPRATAARDHSEPEPVSSEEVDPLKLLGSSPQRTPPKRQTPTVQDLDQSPVAGHYSPPAVISPTPSAAAPPAGGFIIPEGYDPLSDDFIQPPTAPPPTPPPAPPTPVPPVVLDPPTPAPAVEPIRPTPRPQRIDAPRRDLEPKPIVPPVVSEAPVPLTTADDGAAGLAALLAGAGLTDIPATPELARSFGQIFRVVVEGVMDVLRSRQQIKDEFRMRMTQFRPADNNPLKFSANVDDALHNLLVKRNPAYLGPVDAFEDAFDDLRNHQLAMLEGMRVAFEAMIAEFDPDRLEKHFDRQLKRAPLLGAIARYRYWDLYRDLRDEMAKDPDARFKKLFGDEFARAYEEQLNRLKAESRAKRAEEDKG